MMYEIIYHYYEKAEKGYSVDDPKNLKKRVGTVDEDTSLDTAALSIIKQLSRRDILVFDVEVFEFSKKKISFKETKGGIVIKNRKYDLDQANSELVESIEFGDFSETLDIPSVATTNNPPQKLIIPRNKPPVQDVFERPPLRLERLDVEHPDHLRMAQRSGGKFTNEKMYPIFQEITEGSGIASTMYYMVYDDRGEKVKIAAECFVLPSRGLSDDFINDHHHAAQSSNSIQLSFPGGGMQDDLPILRR